MLKKIEVNNFTVFENISIDFCGGIDILIGENGTGKTHLLKILYGCDMQPILSLFNCGGGLSSIGVSSIFRDNSKGLDIKILDEKNQKIYSIDEGNEKIIESWGDITPKSIFIPAKEMLSHSKGLLALDRERDIPFDKTLIDIVSKAELGESRTLSEFQKTLLSTISKVIEGEVIYENDVFYVKKNNGLKVPFSMEAEGLCKFGLLWKLIRNGLLNKDSILLWDEPEANLNPKLIPILVDVLLELQRNSVQIFLATHDYNLAKYFEVKRKKDNKVRYHSLYKTMDKGVKVESDNSFSELKNNQIIDESIRLYKEEIKVVFE